MLKLVKLGDVWFMAYGGILHSRDAPVEDPEKWDRAPTLSEEEREALSAEFPDAVAALAPTSTAAPRRRIRAVDVPELADKYVTYHAAAAAKK